MTERTPAQRRAQRKYDRTKRRGVSVTLRLTDEQAAWLRRHQQPGERRAAAVKRLCGMSPIVSKSGNSARRNRRETMNAFELYDAVFDSAREEYQGSTHEERVEDVIQYAAGALDLMISSEVAERIVAAKESFLGLDEAGGEYEDAFFHKVRKPLEAIEL